MSSKFKDIVKSHASKSKDLPNPDRSPGKKSVTVYLPVDLLKKLDIESVELELNRSQLLEKLVRDYFEGKTDEAE